MAISQDETLKGNEKIEEAILDYKKKLRRKCWRMYLRLSAGE